MFHLGAQQTLSSLHWVQVANLQFLAKEDLGQWKI